MTSAEKFPFVREPEFKSELSFLFQPDQTHLRIESRLLKYVRDEYFILDQYLTSNIGRKWVEAKQNHALNPVQSSKWKSYWPQRIATRLLLRGKEGGVDNWQSILDTSSLLITRSVMFEGGNFNILISSGFIDLELLHSFHPDVLGARIFAIEFEEFGAQGVYGDIIFRFQKALNLLSEVFPIGARLFYESVDTVVPISVIPKLSEGQCVSLSITAAPGVIALTIPVIILLAETMLHEAAHCRLSGINLLSPIWKSGEKLVNSPLRSDLRPISGVFHQCYVLFWLKNYYKKIQLFHEHPLAKRNIPQINKRSNQFESDFSKSVDILNSNRDELTDFGVCLLDSLQERVGANC